MDKATRGHEKTGIWLNTTGPQYEALNKLRAKTSTALGAYGADPNAATYKTLTEAIEAFKEAAAKYEKAPKK